MVSIQSGSSVLSGVGFGSVHTAGRAIHKKNRVHYSMENERAQFGFQVSVDSRQKLTDQTAVFHFDRLNKQDKASLFYGNTPVSRLSSDQARNLVSDDGYFGIGRTSQRIADFVIKGAGNDMERLQAGREGILRGFELAEKAWGGKLPDISYATLQKSLGAIDERIREAGGSVVDLAV